MTYRKPVQWEKAEQIVLARWLDWHQLWWAHVPNGGARNLLVAKSLKAQGVKRGVPDVLIFDPPPKGDAGYVGAAIELKAEGRGSATEHQRAWMEALRERGWAVRLADGAKDAIKWLEWMGYGTGKATVLAPTTLASLGAARRR